MKIKVLALLFLFIANSLHVIADDNPIVSPTLSVRDSEGNETEVEYNGQAPVQASFMANPLHSTGWDAYYEWRFYHNSEQKPYLLRYEENTSYTFNRSGQHKVVLYAKFVHGTDTIEQLCDPISITLSESKLEMPNAFSPNGDGINDIYQAKPNSRSIVDFHATIYNRWGQKLYEWNDIYGGWDGKFHGKAVNDGVYFVVVDAHGADGKHYKIKRDVNLLRGYTESGQP